MSEAKACPTCKQDYFVCRCDSRMEYGRAALAARRENDLPDDELRRRVTEEMRAAVDAAENPPGLVLALTASAHPAFDAAVEVALGHARRVEGAQKYAVALEIDKARVERERDAAEKALAEQRQQFVGWLRSNGYNAANVFTNMARSNAP